VTERPADLPEFANEPLHEVAVGVLFERLDGFRQAHFGRFWSLIADEYPGTVDRERIESGVEPLVPGPIRRSLGFKLIESAPTDRAWFVSADNTRLIQLQDDRLLVNWRRAGSEYPRFEAIRDEFEARFVQFGRLAADEGIGPLAPLQVEVSYFNRIVGAKPAEFLRSAPALDLAALGLTPSDDVIVSRALVPGADGRPVAALTAEVQPLPLDVDGEPTAAYQFALSYRQPLGSEDPGAEIQAALLQGRDTIVRSFSELTSTTMHERWERIK
jgi:uncharacterized protein (TIGR04255 family)